MNNTGAFAFITFLVVVFIFIAFFSLGLGGFISTTGHAAVVSSGMTGLEAFLFDNLNLFIIGGLALGMFAVIYYGGGL